jgi:hypothetical protein
VLVSEKIKEKLSRRPRDPAKERASVSMARAREEWEHRLSDQEKEQRRNGMRKVIGGIGAMGP